MVFPPTLAPTMVVQPDARGSSISAVICKVARLEQDRAATIGGHDSRSPTIKIQGVDQGMSFRALRGSSRRISTVSFTFVLLLLSTQALPATVSDIYPATVPPNIVSTAD